MFIGFCLFQQKKITKSFRCRFTDKQPQLTDTQLQKLKNVVKIRTGTTLRISLKMFNGNDLPHQLLLTTRQKTKLKYAFNNNMSTDTKLSKVQISKII